MIIAVVGAGGKTSFIKKSAKRFLEAGKTVFVTTSTHMFMEEGTLLTDDAEQIIQHLKQYRYAMAGVQEGEKIKRLSKETYEAACEAADVVLVEADGSKHLPLKFPSETEPVIYDNVDEIVVMCGLHALGMKAGEAVHRFELAKQHMDFEEDTIIEEHHIEELLQKGYLEPLQQKYPNKKIRVEYARGLVEHDNKVGCIIMASGLSKRFGRNKLLAEFNGKTFIERTLQMTGDALFDKRVVLTRSPEIIEICEKYGVEVCVHTLPKRNEAVALGIEMMKEMDACVFCPCDQPLLKRESLEKLKAEFINRKMGIIRLCSGERDGAPVLFGKEYFEKLMRLPEKKGGSYLAKKYPEKVIRVMAKDESELQDIDTPEDYNNLIRQYEKNSL